MLERVASKGVLMCHTQTIKVTLRGAWATPCTSVWTSNMGTLLWRHFNKVLLQKTFVNTLEL